MQFLFLALIITTAAYTAKDINTKRLIISVILASTIFLPFLIDKYIYSTLLLWSIGITLSYTTFALLYLAVLASFLSLQNSKENIKALVPAILLLNGFTFNYAYKILIFVSCLLILFYLKEQDLDTQMKPGLNPALH